MDPMIAQIIVAGIVELLAAPIIVAVIVKKLNRFDAKRDAARAERVEDKKQEREQREAEHEIILAISRTMLLNNYERCVDKGYYSVEEREIYSALYERYRKSGGNGVLDTIAERIRKLPIEPPDEDR